MKSALLPFIILFATVTSFPLSEPCAQSPPANPLDLSKLLASMKTKMELTREQDIALSELYRDYGSRRKSILHEYPDDSEEDGLARTIEIRRLNREIMEKIEAVLEPGQVDEYRRLREKEFENEREMSRDSRLERVMQELTDRLSLSEEQVGRIRPVLDEQSDRMAALWKKAGERGPEGMGSMRGDMERIMKETEEKLEKILTADQMREYRKMVEERRERMRMMRDERSPRGYRGERPF